MDFYTPEESMDLWHLPNVGEDFGGPLQPKVIGLDIHLFCLLVEPSTEEGRGCGHKVLCCLDSGISIGVTHLKGAASFGVPDRLLGGGQRMPPRGLEEQRRVLQLAILWYPPSCWFQRDPTRPRLLNVDCCSRENKTSAYH